MKGPDAHMHIGVYLQGELLGASICWFLSNIEALAQVVGIVVMSSSNFGKSYTAFIYSEIIFIEWQVTVRSLGIGGWKCLVCTFSPEDS